MKLQFLFITALLAAIISGCGKPVEKKRRDMVGNWSNSTTTLDIKASGDASWWRIATTIEKASGKARIKNNTLTIYATGPNKHLTIHAYPYREQAGPGAYNTLMVINAETLYRAPKVPIDLKFQCSNGVQDGNETSVDCGGSCNPCPTCSDQVKNQNETGIDCGGNCVPCAEAPCRMKFAANSGSLMTCPGNTTSALQKTFSNPDFIFTDSSSRYTIQNTHGQWDIILALPKKPTGSLVYELIQEISNIDENSDYNLASIELKHNFGFNSGTAFSKSGQLFVTVTNGVITFTFCDIEFSSYEYGCMKASGKLER